MIIYIKFILNYLYSIIFVNRGYDDAYFSFSEINLANKANLSNLAKIVSFYTKHLKLSS